MASLLLSFSLRKVLLLYLVLFLFSSVLLCSSSEPQLQSSQFLRRRKLLGVEKEDKPLKKKISSTTSTTTSSLSAKNQTKPVKPSLSSKNQTKLVKHSISDAKNQTKIVKSTNNSTKSLSVTKIEIKKLNSTSKTKKLNSTSKASDSTKSNTSSSNNKTSDLIKLSSAKNKTTKPTTTTNTKQTQIKVESQKPNKNQKTDQKPPTNQKPIKKKPQPSWIEQDEEDDLVSEFTGLPSKFQQTLIPDLEKISMTSKAYLNKYNKEITKGFKPIVGNKYASTIASFVSFAFILIPLLLVSLIFNRIKAYFSIQKLLIFIQVYLAIYFTILCLSSLVTGLEPLKFFYATSKSNYICLQVLQTLGYVLYLLLLLMYLILVFSTDCGLGSKLLGLAQTFVGFAIGLHYYVAVFHRVVLHQPPKTNWKVHGIYATCYFLICLCATAERRKKAYLEEGGEEGKKN
ncbi:hypothetical protein FEM48_Zijuj08G0162800 [Ziziphus jujuba var. spinosa]|uniref:Uncharacterized protein n=1 Tax=Ziziphus jujuba var. spinosa TaxID=714518 RepID=A0A978V039_ZIZJJ|nr:hypothetical protein FEM48_Zijuj08G0162800 [Ziziphus jujuba var. spinosa]